MAWSQDRVYRLVRNNGGSRHEARFLASVVPGESGGRLNVENSIGAFGLFQIYDGKPGAARRLRGRPNRQAKEALGKLRSQGKGAWAASQGSWQPYKGHGGKGYTRTRGRRGGTRTALTGKLVNTPGVSHAADRLQAKQSLLSSTGSKMPSQGQLLNLAGTLKDLKDEPGTQSFKLGKKTVRTGGGGSSPRGGKGYPHGVGPHGTPNLLIHIGNLARQMGLHAGENPNFGGVGGGHVSGSYHYRNEAIDVSGDPAKMAKFARVVSHRYGKHLAELIWRGRGPHTIKHGKHVPYNFYNHHQDHVHVAVGRGGRGTA